MSLVKIVAAETPQERAEAIERHRLEVENAMSDSETLTAFLRDCTTMDGEPILKPDERAVVEGKNWHIEKLN